MNLKIPLVLIGMLPLVSGGCAYYSSAYPAYPATYPGTVYQPPSNEVIVQSAPSTATAYYTTSSGVYYVAPSPYYSGQWVYAGGPNITIGAVVPFGYHGRFRHFHRGRW